MYFSSLFSLFLPQLIFFYSVETHSSIITSNTNKLSDEVTPNYYWREYTGKIPADAVIGGQDFNGDNVYIGQAYLKDVGLMIGQVKSGSTEVAVASYGVEKVTNYIKILCGRPSESFVWIPTNATSLHVTLLNKHPIIGGHEDDYGTMNIGRISYEGSTQIGKIKSFVVGNAFFHWADLRGKDPGVNTYEVLVYQEPRKQ